MNLDDDLRKATRCRITIIGAGLAGLATAARLKIAGESDFVVLDRGASVGGVWRANQYPNAACDSPVELYAFTFHRKTNWSSNFAPWHEILDYAKDMADHFALQEHLNMNVEVVSAHWDEPGRLWRIMSADGRAWVSDFLIWVGGLFNQPSTPTFAHAAEFQGKVMHTAAWDDSFDLAGLDVAVVGAGASSIQVLPHAAAHARQVHAFVRTPSHVLPKPEQLYGQQDWKRFEESPSLLEESRQTWFEHFENLARSRFPMNEALIDEQETMWRDFLEQEIADADLRTLLTPRYRFGCRRPLVSNEYYKAIASSHVRVLGEGVADLYDKGVVTESGERIPVDAIILATGFKTSGMLGALDIRGRDSISLAESWAEAPHAYLGMLVHGFPNLFLVGGPNATAASLSAIVESQIDYIEACLAMAKARSPGARVEVSAHAQERFIDDIRQRGNASVMVQGGCDSYYRTGADGVVFTHWPGTCRSYQEAVKAINTADLIHDGQGADA